MHKGHFGISTSRTPGTTHSLKLRNLRLKEYRRGLFVHACIFELNFAGPLKVRQQQG
jgi:hypothetical protein